MDSQSIETNQSTIHVRDNFDNIGNSSRTDSDDSEQGSPSENSSNNLTSLATQVRYLWYLPFLILLLTLIWHYGSLQAPWCLPVLQCAHSDVKGGFLAKSVLFLRRFDQWPICFWRENFFLGDFFECLSNLQDGDKIRGGFSTRTRNSSRRLCIFLLETCSPPQFYSSILQAHKSMNWTKIGDFTSGHASIYKRHVLHFAKGALSLPLEILLLSDKRLSELASKGLPFTTPVPFFSSAVPLLLHQ